MSKPLGKVKLEWSPAFAYAVGLIVSDGNLSPDGRHITFTSKDFELIECFLHALGLPDQHIGKKSRGGEQEKKYFVVQIGDVLFYRFLLGIGITPKKSLTIGAVDIPDQYFSHFVREVFDGDGTTYSYWDPRWKSSFMYYISFASASPFFLVWFQGRIETLFGVRGRLIRSRRDSMNYLTFAKQSSGRLASVMYASSHQHLYLSRKYLKIIQAFATVSAPKNHARVEKLVNSPA